MAINFRGKKAKDFEAPMDSIVHNSDFFSSGMGKTGMNSSSSITSRLFLEENPENHLEKRNKEFQ